MTVKNPETSTDVEDRKSTVDAIEAEIVRRICFLDYPPDFQLKEADLTSEFGVSRTPVRDAISRIKYLGLIETRNGVGTVVTSLSKEQIQHVYEVRLQLATSIGTVTPRPVTEQDRKMMTELLEAAIYLQNNFDPRRYIELNDRLQNLISNLIGNTLLRSFWLQAYVQAASTWYRIATLAGAEMAASLVQELTEMKAALDSSDMAAVGYVQRVHIGYGHQRILRHFPSDNEN